MDQRQRLDFIMQWEQQFLPPLESAGDEFYPLLCTDCFQDEGLRLAAVPLGVNIPAECPNCHSMNGLKLSGTGLRHLMSRYFSSGSIVRCDYGGFPAFVCNELRQTEISVPIWLQADLELLSAKSGRNVIPYGPRAWMYGEVAPLKKMLDPSTQNEIFERISAEYPTKILAATDRFYRVRINVSSPESIDQYDSPPMEFCGKGRLESPDFPVMYGSQDLHVCIHECRSTADDDIFVATLVPNSTLRLLDLAVILPEDSSVTEFESLDLAVHMLFLAKAHSYPLTRSLAKFLGEKGFDGVLYPSYFSLLRTGARLFETVYGMSIRRIEQAKKYASGHVIPNVGLFGRPLADGKVSITCIDKVILERAQYDINFGPVGAVGL